MQMKKHSTDETSPNGAELLTTKEVARRLRVDHTTVRRWIKTGTLEAIVLPHRGSRLSYRLARVTVDAIFSQTPDSSLEERPKA